MADRAVTIETERGSPGDGRAHRGSAVRRDRMLIAGSGKAEAKARDLIYEIPSGADPAAVSWRRSTGATAYFGR
jgi:hypothetical protein